VSAGPPSWRASASLSSPPDLCGRLAGEYVASRGDREQDGCVGEVAASPRQTSGTFGEAGGVGRRAGSNPDVYRATQMVSSTPPVLGTTACVGFERAMAKLLGPRVIGAIEGKDRADREGERVARVLPCARQREGRFAG
jgi:hypothetical protein